MISTEDYLAYVDQALDAMLAVAYELGDQLVSTRPDLPGANSAYGLTVHCLGVATYWAGGLVAGRVIHRDRAAEFEAMGTVGQLVAAVQTGRAQLALDLAAVEASAPPRGGHEGKDSGLPGSELTQGVVLMHVLEELYQHLGQMELIRDVLLAATRARPPAAPPG